MSSDKKLLIIGFMTIVFSLFLGLIGTGNTNRIVNINYSKVDFEQKILPTSQEITIEFTRPLINNQNFSELVNLEPETELEYQLQSNKLIIRPLQVLDYDLSYKLIIKNEIKDIFQKNLITNYEEIFETSRSLYLIEDPNDSTVGINLTSNLFLKDANNPDFSLLIAEDAPIVSTAVDPNRKFIAYSTEPILNDPHNLFLYNLENRQTTQLKVKKNLLIEQLQFDEDGELWFYGSISDNELFSLTNEDYPEVFSNIYRYNIQNSELSESGVNLDIIKSVTRFWLPSDGNTLLIQTFDYDILIIDQNNPERFISIGRFNEIGGFNLQGDKLAVVEVDNTVLEFITNSKIISPNEELFSSSDEIVTTRPNLSLNGDLLAVSQRVKTIPTAEGIFRTKLIKLNEQSELEFEPKIIYINSEDSDRFSYYLPQFNNSGKYLAVESTNIEILEDIKRDIRSQTNAGQALKSNTIIYEISENNEISQKAELTGDINLKWLP